MALPFWTPDVHVVFVRHVPVISAAEQLSHSPDCNINANKDHFFVAECN